MRKIFNKLDNSKKVTNISKDKPQTVDEIIKKWTVNEKIVKLFENSINNELELKQKYAITLIIILAIQLIILNIIFILVGTGKLKYTNSTFNLFITGGLAEIFILIKVIVKHLFNNNLAESLNIILDRNNQRINYNYKNNFKKNASNFQTNELKNNNDQI